MRLFFKQIIKESLFKTAILFFPRHNKITRKDTAIATLLCHQYVYMYIFTVLSFYKATETILPLYVIDDGTLTLDDKKLLKLYFSITFVTKEASKRNLKKTCGNKYQHIMDFIDNPKTTICKWKLALELTCPYDKFICLDSDILFRKKAIEIKEWIDNSINKLMNLEYEDHLQSNNYNIDETVKDLNHSYRLLLKLAYAKDANPLLNAGILCVPAKSFFSLTRINKLLKIIKDTSFNNEFAAEEVVISSAIPKEKMSSLPKKMYITQLDAIRREYKNITCLHYSYKAKTLFFMDGLLLAIKTKFFHGDL